MCHIGADGGGYNLLGYAPVGRAVPDFVTNPRQLEGRPAGPGVEVVLFVAPGQILCYAV